jgi:glycosyltransferase involved in cell wall biosynthesis
MVDDATGAVHSFAAASSRYMVTHSAITILLPVYNHARYLPRALDALAAQEQAPGEIIIIDDASTDGSADVAEDMRRRLEPATNLRILRNSNNLGVNLSTNRGLSEVTGTYVTCTAADDWLRPRFVSAMTDAIARFPDAKLVTSRYVEFIEADGSTHELGPNSERGLWYTDDRPRLFAGDDLLALLSRGYVMLPVSASIIHTRTLREFGGFDPALKWHADWFVATAISLRHGFAVVPEPLAVFRVASGTYSTGNMKHPQRQREVCNAISNKLGTAEFADIRRYLLRAPVLFSPFVRHLIPALVRRPRDWDILSRLTLWWLQEASKGRRPGRLRALVESLGVDMAPRGPSRT